MIEVELSAPERVTVRATVKEVIVPGADGVFTVRAGHTPLLTTLAPGVLAARDEAGQETFYAVNGGFAEVKSDTVSILADAFEPGQDIDLVRAQAAQERAQTRLQKPAEDTDVERAERALARSFARISAHQHKRY